MKVNMKISVIAVCGLIVLGCGGLNKVAELESSPPAESTLQQRIDAEARKVRISVVGKETITKGELVQDRLLAVGYDSSYAIRYGEITPDEQSNSVSVVFYLKKDGLISQPVRVSIDGFKVSRDGLSDQEKINAAVDRVVLTADNKAAIVADDLTPEQVSPSSYDSNAYTLHYKAFQADADKKEVEITFFLYKKEDFAVKSKERTVKIEGFKERILAPAVMDITAQDILKLFQLTETKISASAAAKKIAAGQSRTIEGYFFEQTGAVAYDDREGSFTVAVKGKKDGKTFDREITVAGFTHPYASYPGSIDTSGENSSLNFENAIKNNLSIERYIADANAGNGAQIAQYFKKGLSFILENGGKIDLGDFNDYRLSAVLHKESDDSVRIKPRYVVKFYKKVRGSDQEYEEQVDSYSSFYRFETISRNPLVKPYFDKDAVFYYILAQTDETVINVRSDRFASEFYAQTKMLGNASGDLFNLDGIQNLLTTYAGDGGRFKMKIAVAVYNKSIEADDYAGSLRLQYCIASEEQIGDMHETYSAHPPIVAIKEVSVKGFAKVPADETIHRLFTFALGKADTNSSPETWKKRQIGPYQPLLRDTGASTLEFNYSVDSQVLQAIRAQGYYLILNGRDVSNSEDLAGQACSLSKATTGHLLLVESVTVGKNPGDEYLELTMSFKGSGEPVVLRIKPSH